MNELTKRDVKKSELQYLDGIVNIQKKHMELITDLMEYPTLGKDILDIKERKDILKNNLIFNSELQPPYKKQKISSKNKIE